MNLQRSPMWLAVLVLSCAATVQAQTILYVDDDASADGDGASWGTAYRYLQDALVAAGTSGVETHIRVAQGAYTPDRDESGHVTPGDRSATFQLLNGVELKGGYAGIGAPDPDLRDVDSNASILSGDIGIIGDTSDNSYSVVTGADNATLDGFTVTGGTGTSYAGYLFGGGMFNNNCAPAIGNCVFAGNQAQFGAGMANYDSSPTVTDCAFRVNEATTGGGGMSNNTSSPTVTDCTFSGNSAAEYGGGMLSYSGTPTVTNCVFNGNAAGWWAGGMRNLWSNPSVINCTFAGNTADTYGGAMENYNCTPTLTNCILWGNTAPADPQIWGNATVIYSDVQGGTGQPWFGTGCIDANPLFMDADGADNTLGTEDDNLRLSGGSPCIDAGSNGAVPGNITTDLADHPRFWDDPATPDTGHGTPPIVDMGAYEYSLDCNANDVPDICDLDCDALSGACNLPGCGQSNDCNSNGTLDACDILGGTSADCNTNGVPDECDIGGTIVAWGANYYGQCNVSSPNADFVGVAGGMVHSLGLKSDGSIVAWGDNTDGQCDVPSPNTDFVGVAGGAYHSLGLKSDGTIVAWGANHYGQCNVPS
ncbi:MAG: hypothetical protein GY842_19005, partial [bacterium]|nr:hypothetical protein [bacterium]